MSEPRVLIVFTTKRGHTRAVAKRMAEVVAARGLGAVLADLARVPDRLPVDDVDGVILAGPVHFGRHPRRLRAFAKRNRAALEGLPSAFVSVSGAAMGDDPEHRSEARGYADGFAERTGWTPDRTCLAGGAVAYTKYNPLLRRVMRSISRKEGRSTDTSRDHDYTDWDAVEGFAEEFGELVARRAGVRRAVSRNEREGESRARERETERERGGP